MEQFRMSNYETYSKEQMIHKIESLERENKFLKDYIRGTKDFKELTRLIKNNFGGDGE